MRKSAFVFSVAALFLMPQVSARAANPLDAAEAMALVDKAIKAIGGEDAISKMKVVTWKSKGKLKIMDGDAEITTTSTAQGIDHYRQEMDGDFGGNEVHIVTTLAGDKGLRSYGGNTMDLDETGLGNQRRTVYLTVIPITLVDLKSKDFKLDTVADDKVGDKAVAGILVTPKDKREFKLYFDKETGLPAKMVAEVAGFRGGEPFMQETHFSDYKEMAGIKKATKIIDKREGERFRELTITEFKALDKVDPKTFTDAT
jgi:hypothetical protein